MKQSTLLLALFALCVTLFSCGDDDSLEGSSSSVASVSNNIEFQAEVAKFSVDLLAKCCQLNDAQKAKFQMLFFGKNNESIDVVAEGWAEFNATKANACLQKAASSELSCSNANIEIADCEQVLTPKQQMGEPCGKEVGGKTVYYDDVCMTGLVCGSDVVCVTAKQIGEACNDNCGANSYCDGSVCVAQEENAVMSFDQATCEQIKAVTQP